MGPNLSIVRLGLGSGATFWKGVSFRVTAAVVVTVTMRGHSGHSGYLIASFLAIYRCCTDFDPERVYFRESDIQDGSFENSVTQISACIHDDNLLVKRIESSLFQATTKIKASQIGNLIDVVGYVRLTVPSPLCSPQPL